MLAAGLVVLALLGATGIPASASAGEDPPAAPAPPPSSDNVAGVVRLRCAAEGDSSVGRKDVLIRRDGTVHFRIETGFPADLLYARRPKDIGISRGTELPSTTGTFYRELSLGRGHWLVGCFTGAFSTRDHPPADYALIRVGEAE